MSIKLDRVEFISAINVPGEEAHQFPTREKIVISRENPTNRLSSSKHFNLTLDEERGIVVVAHPKNPSAPVMVPLSNVESWREASAEKAPAKK